MRAAGDVRAEQHKFRRIVDGAGLRGEQPAIGRVELEGRRRAYADCARVVPLQQRAAVEAGDLLRAPGVDGNGAKALPVKGLHLRTDENLALHALAKGAVVEVVHDDEALLARLLRFRGLGAQVAEGKFEETLPGSRGLRLDGGKREEEGEQANQAAAPPSLAQIASGVQPAKFFSSSSKRERSSIKPVSCSSQRAIGVG